MSIAIAQTLDFGVSVATLDAAGVLGDGKIIPQFKVGSVCTGENGGEWIYVKIVLASQTDLPLGTWMAYDQDFTAVLLLHAATGVRGQGVGVTAFNSLATAAGTYYGWLQRAGSAPARWSASPNLAGAAETDTTTDGLAKQPASVTVGNKTIQGAYAAKVNQTFTATTVNGSTTITPTAGATKYSGPFVGATLSGTGIASSQTIVSITYDSSGNATSMVISAAASASNAGVTVTATLTVETMLYWPYLDKTN